LLQSDDQKTYLLKTAYGNGQFILSSTPLIFTNYSLLNPHNARFAATSLSYLPVQPTLWDEYYKAGKRPANTPLLFILTQEALRWAYFFAIFALFLFIIFESKRKQRIIPVIEQPQNRSIQFVTTIGLLYYQYADHRTIALKKIACFLDLLRNRFFVRTNEFSEAFYETLAKKSGKSLIDIRKLFAAIITIQGKSVVSEHDLLVLDKRLELFNEHVGEEVLN
jgi:hypothetical protein